MDDEPFPKFGIKILTLISEPGLEVYTSRRKVLSVYKSKL